MNNRIVTTWFPERERASTIGIYTSAQYVGLGFLTPLLVWMEAGYGWRSVFVFTGVLGLAVAAIWALVYRDPDRFRGTNQAERDLIAEGGGIPDLSTRLAAQQSKRDAFSWHDLAIVLSRKKLWGIYIGQFCYLASANFFLTWFPTYLVQYRHLDFIKAASIPFLAGFAGVLVSGFFSDALLRRGFTLGASRKIPVLVGIALSVLIIGAQFVDAPELIILFLCLRSCSGAPDRPDRRGLQPLRRALRRDHPDRDRLSRPGRRFRGSISNVFLAGDHRGVFIHFPGRENGARRRVISDIGRAALPEKSDLRLRNARSQVPPVPPRAMSTFSKN
ncbi:MULTISPECIES: MFS transporter [Rhizobium/Agrobacterium group]|uniref:MFS transporter n=1 Tax=Rhizobium/Agrobacterium group TaxID=227290 RepID=UPI001A9CD64A|nr:MULTISPECIES: MFS transporter [Rhizobium/Agrobacterium group]